MNFNIIQNNIIQQQYNSHNSYCDIIKQNISLLTVSPSIFFRFSGKINKYSCAGAASYMVISPALTGCASILPSYGSRP